VIVRASDFIVVLMVGVLGLSTEILAQPATTARGEMKLSEAKKVIRQQMGHMSQEVVQISSNRIVFRIYSRDRSNSLTCEYSFENKKIELIKSGFATNPNVRTGAADCGSGGEVGFQQYCASDDACERFYRALLFLQERARRHSSGASAIAEAKFAEVVEEYRRADPKPQFPEAARKFRVQAESAMRDRQFDDAAELYEEALKVAPWWPQGRFNLAHILGELEEYGEAMAEMRKYLALVPGVSNARAAQDKIYEWEGKVGR
jgi:tetratricopeptide (TPR) repeat protein